MPPRSYHVFPPSRATAPQVAPVTHIAEEEYYGLHPSLLVSLFLVVNVLVSLGEPLIVEYLGLRTAVLIGASLMFGGCAIKVARARARARAAAGAW